MSLCLSCIYHDEGYFIAKFKTIENRDDMRSVYNLFNVYVFEKMDARFCYEIGLDACYVDMGYNA